MTVLEAHVAEDKWDVLQARYNQEIKQLEPGLEQTFLLHSSSDPSLWRIATIWSSREALAAMRQSGRTPTGVLIFRATDAEPTLMVFDVVSAIRAE